MGRLTLNEVKKITEGRVHEHTKGTKKVIIGDVCINVGHGPACLQVDDPNGVVLN